MDYATAYATLNFIQDNQFVTPTSIEQKSVESKVASFYLVYRTTRDGKEKYFFSKFFFFFF